MTRAKIIAGKAVIVIEAVDRVDKILGQIRNKLHRFANFSNQIGSSLTKGGILGGLGSGLVLNSFLKFDDLMLELRTKLDLYDKSADVVEMTMGKLERRIRSLGKTTSFTSKEVAAGAIELAKGGLSPKEIQNSLQAVLDLGRGTKSALDTAGKFFVRTMRTFNLEATQANEIVSQFVRATRKGTLDIDDLDAALRYSSGTAANLEQNLAPILAILTELSNKGLAGSIGGTSLNTAMANLVKKLEDIRTAFPGFDPVYNQQGFDLVKTLEVLFEKTKDLSTLDRVTLFQDLFNLRGSRAISGAKDIKKIIELSKTIQVAGNEGRVAAKIMDSGLGGAVRRTTSALENLNNTLGESAKKYLVPVLEAIRAIINELNTLANNNPAIAAAVLLSPAALLAGGLGFLALGKAARIAAVAVGGFQSVYRLMARTVGGAAGAQFKAFKGLAGGKAVQKAIPKVKKAAVSKSSLGHLGASASGKARAAAPAAITNAKKYNRTLMARKAILAKELAANQKNLKSIVAFNKVSSAGGRKVSGAARVRLLKEQASIQARMARNSARIAKAPKLTKAFSVGKAGTGLLKFGKGLLSVANIARRFVFSGGGLITILEILLTFTSLPQKIAAGFGGAFKAIGNIVQLASGPLELFKVSIEAFSAGKGQLGLMALKESFQSLIGIIGSQLVAAWNRFKQGLGPVWTIITGITRSIMALITHIVQLVTVNLQDLLGRWSDSFSRLGNLFGQGGDLGKGIYESFLFGIRALLEFIGYASSKAAEWSIRLQDMYSDFLERLQGVFIEGARLLGVGSVVDLDIEKEILELHKLNREIRSKSLIKQANKSGDGYQKTIADIFDKLPQEIQARKNADKARAKSEAISARASMRASYLRQFTTQKELQLIEGQAKQDRYNSGPGSPLQQAIQGSRQIASALVGSASSTRRNVLQRGKTIEKKQLEMLTDIRDDQRKGLKNDGDITFK